MFDINGGEFVVILVLIALVIGPSRLPEYARKLGDWAKTAKLFVTQAKENIKKEAEGSLDDVDWEAMDPRQYDPRKIVREAFSDIDEELKK